MSRKVGTLSDLNKKEEKEDDDKTQKYYTGGASRSELFDDK